MSVFVGAERQRLVDDLVARVDGMRSTPVGQLVVLRGPSGTGKTRIARELYARLAALQEAPGYWPPEIITGAAGDTTGFTSRRAVLHTAPFAVAPGATPSFLWIGVPCGRQPGVPDAPVALALEQVRIHLRQILDRLARRALRKGAAVRLARALAPLPDVFGTFLDITDLGKDFLDELRQRRADQSRDTDVDLRSADLERVETLAELLGSVLTADKTPIPCVLVLDDAHEMDRTVATLVEELLGLDAPILIIATAWPHAGTSTVLDQLLDDVRQSGRSAEIELAPLSEDDLAEYVTRIFPKTDPHVAHLLGVKAHNNPYQLELLLSHRAVTRAHDNDGALKLDPVQIEAIRPGLEPLLLDQWRQLPPQTQTMFGAAALLGPRFFLAAVHAGLGAIGEPAAPDITSTWWVRSFSGFHDLAEFVERLRFEIALDHASREIDESERSGFIAAATEAIAGAWVTCEAGIRRQILAGLLVELAKSGANGRLGSAAAAAEELAELVRDEVDGEAAVEYASLAEQWFRETGGTSEDLVRAGLLVCELRRGGREGRAPMYQPTLQLAEQAERDLGTVHPLTIRCWLAVIRCCRTTEHPDRVAFGATHLDRISSLVDSLPDLPLDVRRDFLMCRYAYRYTQLGATTAVQLAQETLDMVEQHYGPLHRWTLEVLYDVGYYLARVDTLRAVEVRRLAVARYEERFGSRRHRRVLGVIADLAWTLTSVGTLEAVNEAMELVEHSYQCRLSVYGAEHRKSRNIRLNRSRTMVALAELEAASDPAASERHLAEALEEAREVLELRLGRQGRETSGSAIARQRLGEALSASGLHDEAEAQLGLALDVRRNVLHEADTTFAMVSLMESIRLAHERRQSRPGTDQQ